MTRIRIKYYFKKPSGRAYWRPTKRMRNAGFQLVPLGMDGPEAWALAEQWNRRWQACRRGDPDPPEATKKLARDQAEAARKYPPGSVGSAFQRFIRTDEWKGKALSARNKVWWPAWYRIRFMWGDVAPDTITFEQMSKWRTKLEKDHGRGVAHKTIRVWRALWTVMTGMKIARGADPSKGIRNRAPKPRHQRWSEGEAVQLAKGAWRHGFRGLACIIASAWDTQFSPVDVRTLTAAHRYVTADGRLIFDRTEDGRTKTGRAVIGTLTRRSERLIGAYLSELGTGVTLAPSLILFRNRSGNPYREDTLSDDFAELRTLVFGPDEKRQLRDMRRSGTVEGVAGGAEGIGIAAKMGNSIDRSNVLHRTYAPVDVEAVRNFDEARLRGRRKMRANRSGGKVSPGQSGGDTFGGA